MLKISYEREDQIPENLKGAYVADASGVFVLDQLDKKHPVLVKNAELLSKNTSLQAINAGLTQTQTEYEAKLIPDGHIAVPVGDSALLAKLKESGVSVEELPTLKAENDQLKAEKAAIDATNIRKKAAASLGYAEDAFVRLTGNLPIQIEGDSFVVGDDKKPLTKEYIEQHEDFKPFLASLSVQKSPLHGNGGDPPPAGAGDTAEVVKAAQQSQARITKNHF